MGKTKAVILKIFDLRNLRYCLGVEDPHAVHEDDVKEGHEGEVKGKSVRMTFIKAYEMMVL